MSGTVLVTGASQGIGAATAAAFAEAGLAGGAGGAAGGRARHGGGGAGTGSGHLAVACDVTDPEAVDGLFARIAAEAGRLDAVFNNAGASHADDPGRGHRLGGLAAGACRSTSTARS